jgi:hypothetical protein
VLTTTGGPAQEISPAERSVVIEPGGEVTLPARVVHDLRLLRPEPFAVFSDGRHFIHMVRADAGPAALGVAERISLHGTIEGFGIADLFSLLNMSRRSGVLLLITDRVQKSIFFRRGEIVSAESNAPEDRLEQILYRTGKLDRGGLEAVERRAQLGQGPEPSDAVLRELGLLDAATLSWGLRHQVEEIVYSVFRLTQGSFLLLDGDFVDAAAAQVAIDTNNVLMEGYQRVDELGLISQHIRGHGTVLRPTGRQTAAKIGDRLQRLLALVDGRTPVEEIVRATGWGEFNTFKALYKLIQAGLAEVAEGSGRSAAPHDGDPARGELAMLVETYNRAFMLLRDVLRAKAVEIDLGRAFDSFRRGATEATRAVFHGITLGAGRRFPPESLIDNAEHLLLLETNSLAGAPPVQRRRDLIAQALADWTSFQGLLVRNLLPSGEARELISYVLAIVRSQESPRG